MKIVFTGGHPSPAFACIEYIQEHYPEYLLVFIGRSVSQPKFGQPAWESETAAAYNVPFYALNTGKTGAPGFFAALGELLKTGSSIFRALRILHTEKPDVCLSFGSYVAVPTVIAAWLLRIPIITHEQTRGAGKSNQLISKLAQKTAVSFESSCQFFPKKPCVVVGLPLRPTLFKTHPKPNWLEQLPKDKTILVVLGGSTGSHWINELVIQVARSLIRHTVIVHQTGLPSQSVQWLEKAERFKKTLSSDEQLSYYPRATFDISELSWLYQHASGAVSRAGANTVAELLAFSLPTVYIPLPLSAAGEQVQNAEHAVEQNSANVVCTQDNLSDAAFTQAVIKLLTDHTERQSFQKLSLLPQEKIMSLLTQAVQSAKPT